jgi:hypothetical protein
MCLQAARVCGVASLASRSNVLLVPLPGTVARIK